MKKLFLTICMLLSLVSVSFAGTSTTTLTYSMATADAAITTAAGLFHGFVFATDGTNAVTVDIYDNATTAAGTNMIPTMVLTSSATDRVQTLSFNPPIPYYNGMYVDITTAGTTEYMMIWETKR